MIVVTAVYRDVVGWLHLAAEVEPLFGMMLDSPEFYQHLLRQIGRSTAFCVREGDGPPGVPLRGALLYSPARSDRPEHHIASLAVAARWQRSGVGRALVAHTGGLVEPSGTISLITFGEDKPGGRPARRFYERLGFHAGEAAPRGPEGGMRQVFRRTLP